MCEESVRSLAIAGDWHSMEIEQGGVISAGRGKPSLVQGAFTGAVLFQMTFVRGIIFKQVNKRTGIADRGTNS